MGNVEAQKWYHDDLDTEKKLKIDQSINTIFIWLSISQEERRKQFTSTRQYRKPGKRRKYFTQCLQQLVDARRRLCSDEKVVRNDAFQYVDTFIDNLPQQFKTKYHNNAVENKEIEQFKKDKIIQDAVIDGLNTCINVEKNSDNNNETNKDVTINTLKNVLKQLNEKHIKLAKENDGLQKENVKLTQENFELKQRINDLEYKPATVIKTKQSIEWNKNNNNMDNIEDIRIKIEPNIGNN
eukprot:259080_1